MSQFTLIAATLGVIRGVHTPYIRPDKLTADESQVDALFKDTEGYTNINARSVAKSGIVGLTLEANTSAQLQGGSRWNNERSFGTLIVDLSNANGIIRYHLGFYIPTVAVYNGAVDPQAILYLNSCTEMKLTRDTLQYAQTDIIQRMTAQNRNTIVPNTITARIDATPHADGSTAAISVGSTIMRQTTTLGDATTLLAHDSAAATLKAFDGGARQHGPRTSALSTSDMQAMNATCAIAKSNVRERELGDSELLEFILGDNKGSIKNMSISIDKLQATLGNFEFDVVNTEAGDIDFTKTDELNTLAGAISQNIANQVIGLMIYNGLASVTFYATNENGKLEMLVNSNWMELIRTTDIQGLDKDAYMAKAQQTEATIHNEIEFLLLPSLMNQDNMTMLVDISLVTTASVKLSMGGTAKSFSIQTSTSSAWTTINASTTQIATNALATKTILRSILTNVNAQTQDHLN